MPEFDLVLYGATGFTGRLASQYFMQRAKGLRIAIAGRNREKLEALSAQCETRPGIIVADSSDMASVEAMVQRTRAVLSFAGPFALYGEPIIAACARQGRDYLDITGETPFIRQMISRYQEEALRSGARLIPFVGFDSIPADLATFIALKESKSRGISFDALQFYYRIKGGFNGGTLESALIMGESKSRDLLLDGNVLILDESWPKARPLTFRNHFQKALGRWASPFLMGPINRAVVRRSSWLKAQKGEKAPDFHYEEFMLAGKRWGALEAGLGSVAMAVLGGLSESGLGRRFLRTVGPKAGEGPSERSRKSGYFRGQVLALQDGKCRLMITMEREGDPGNEVTVALAYAAASLAAEGAFEAGVSGFLTPTVAFGERLQPKLEAEGFRFSTEQKGA